jgi:hypothetical protein
MSRTTMYGILRQTSGGRVMLKLIGTIVGIVLFCWATVSAFSIFSELRFLVDGWTWSVDQVPVSIKSVALAVGKYVSGIVGGYREFVHGLVAMLHLPRLPQYVYDGTGVIVFSYRRGRSIFIRDLERHHRHIEKLLGADTLARLRAATSDVQRREILSSFPRRSSYGLAATRFYPS